MAILLLGAIESLVENLSYFSKKLKILIFTCLTLYAYGYNIRMLGSKGYLSICILSLVLPPYQFVSLSVVSTELLPPHRMVDIGFGTYKQGGSRIQRMCSHSVTFEHELLIYHAYLFFLLCGTVKERSLCILLFAQVIVYIANIGVTDRELYSKSIWPSHK